MYCTKQDMIDRFGETELAQRTDPDLIATQSETGENN